MLSLYVLPGLSPILLLGTTFWSVWRCRQEYPLDDLMALSRLACMSGLGLVALHSFQEL